MTLSDQCSYYCTHDAITGERIDMQDTSELRAVIMGKINKSMKFRPDLDMIIEEYDDHVRVVNETTWHDDHGNVEFVRVYSVALNDETTDVKFFEIYVAVEGNTVYAETVKPLTEIVTKYVKE